MTEPAKKKKRGRGQSLTPAERVELGTRALDLSSRGVSYRNIAEQIGVQKNTVMSLIHEAIQDARSEDDIEREVMLGEAIQHYKRVVTTVWGFIGAQGRELADGRIIPLMSPHGLSAMLGTAISAQNEMNRLRGLEPDDGRGGLNVQVTFLELARQVEGIPRNQRLRVVDAEELPQLPPAEEEAG